MGDLGNGWMSGMFLVGRIRCGEIGRPQWSFLQVGRRGGLRSTVAPDEAEIGSDGQADGFGNECEGHCGV